MQSLAVNLHGLTTSRALSIRTFGFLSIKTGVNIHQVPHLARPSALVHQLCSLLAKLMLGRGCAVVARRGVSFTCQIPSVGTYVIPHGGIEVILDSHPNEHPNIEFDVVWHARAMWVALGPLGPSPGADAQVLMRASALWAHEELTNL